MVPCDFIVNPALSKPPEGAESAPENIKLTSQCKQYGATHMYFTAQLLKNTEVKQ